MSEVALLKTQATVAAAKVLRTYLSFFVTPSTIDGRKNCQLPKSQTPKSQLVKKSNSKFWSFYVLWPAL
jgi:hypothetical protein